MSYRKEVQPTIYKITNLVNGRVYVGSAWTFNERCYRHFSALRSGKHKNHRLQTDYNVHGCQSFEIQTIKIYRIESISRKKLYEIEQMYIDGLKPYYNIQNKVNGFIMTDDIKKKLSRINSKRWIVTNPNGQEIIVDDMMRFCRENNLRRL